jgi:hypothetical protein
LEQAVQVAVSQNRTQGAQLFGHGHGNLGARKRDSTLGAEPRISRQVYECLMTLCHLLVVFLDPNDL